MKPLVTSLDDAEIDVVTAHPVVRGAIVVATVVGVMAVIVAHRTEPVLAGLLGAMTVALGVLSFIDVAQQRLPNVITLPLAAISWLVVLVWSAVEGRPLDGLGAIGVGLVFAVVLFLFRFGMGDVKLSLSVGAVAMWLGREALLSTIMVVAVAGAVVAVGLMIVYRRRSLTFGYGPFLALGSVAGMILA